MSEPSVQPRPGIASRILIAPIRGYQRWISPVLPPSCRFYPTCSAYAIESLRVHGPLRGTGYTLVRLAKCAPWHRGGIDHVKPPRTPKTLRSPQPTAGADPTPEHHDS